MNVGDDIIDGRDYLHVTLGCLDVGHRNFSPQLSDGSGESQTPDRISAT